ncbi:MAG: ABC transporter ATP-binding protein [Ruminococcus sp.]|jgi:putative ABC transport system ATP-binding protein|nr:ABC transporter ATP-binding protein [Ruminococcus sp.]
MKTLEIKNISKIYGSGENQVRAIDGVDLVIENGEFISIVGSSGSGKTTLLNIIGGLDHPDSGEVIFEGNDITKMCSEELTIFRRRNIGFVFQNYNLIPVLNVYENIVLPLKLDGKKEDADLIYEIVEELGIENKLYQMPDALSGGQQQRVAIARALIMKPAIILADEPTGNLDSRTSGSVIFLMQRMAERFHQTMAIVTHNENIASLGDRMIRIEDGKICE